MLNGKTVIKCVGNRHGEVSLIQLDNDSFYVRTAVYGSIGEDVDFSGEYKDYNMANWLFELKLKEIGEDEQ